MHVNAIPVPSAVAPAPPTRPHRVLRGVIRAVVTVAIFLFGVVVGAAGSGDSPQAPAQNSAAPATSAPASAPAASPQASAPASAPAPSAATTAPVTPSTEGPRTWITNGEWLVGTEIEPGTYRSEGPEDGPVRYASVSTHDASGKMIDWKTSTEGPIRITVTEGQTVSVTGALPFTKVG